MNILLTNDDGIFSEGIRALYESLKQIGNVTIVAPDSERSAVGHAITLSDPLRVKKVIRGGKFFGYATTGTPADCVKLAIRAILKKRPDLVVSGINLGPNVGYSVLYSGTVSGATEGAILGIPSFAISLATFTNPDYSFAADFAKKFASQPRSIFTPAPISPSAPRYFSLISWISLVSNQYLILSIYSVWMSRLFFKAAWNNNSMVTMYNSIKLR